MSDRAEQVYRLLRSYADWEPSITTGTGSVVRTAGSAGETAGRRETCPHCQGTGRAGRGSCRFCKGAGFQWLDPQTGRVVTAPAGDRPFTARDFELGVYRRRVRCDRCGGDGCDRCARSGTVEILDGRPAERSLRRLRQQWPQLRQQGDPAEAPGWWLSAALERKQAQWARGSYPELERLLHRLREEHPGRYRLLDRHLIHPVDGLVRTARVLVTVDDVVRDLADQMPPLIRVPEGAGLEPTQAGRARQLWRQRTSAAHHARALRDEQVREALACWGTQQVAAMFGLSDRRVRQIAGALEAAPPVASALPC